MGFKGIKNVLFKDISMRTLYDTSTCYFLVLSALLVGRPACSNDLIYDDLLEDQEFFDENFIALEDQPRTMPIKQEGNSFLAPSPHFSKGWGIVLNADFLYWKAKEEGLSYALSSPNFTTTGLFAQSDLTKGVKGKISRLDPGYEPGVRLSADFFLPRDHWDLELSWTYYRNTHSSHKTAHPPHVIFPFWLNANFDPLSIKAHAHWNLTLNNFEMTLGRAFCAGKFFSIRPFAGFQAAWIEQHLNINYETVSFDNGQTTPRIKSFNKNDTQGYGITAGFETKWELRYGFSLEGDFSGALLWTDYDLHQHEKNGDNSLRTRIKDNFHQITAVLNLFAGLNWETQFHKERFYLQFHAGWEEQVWFDQNELNRFINNHNVGSTANLQGDLSFSGWTIGGKFGF